MASKQETVDRIVEPLVGLDVSARKMFGEYGLYCGAKLVGSICDDTLFIKTTKAGTDFTGPDQPQASPYPGAKPGLQISPAQIADATWLRELVTLTAAALPAPKPKKPKQAKKA